MLIPVLLHINHISGAIRAFLLYGDGGSIESCLNIKHLLSQYKCNALSGVSRDMLIPLGERTSVDDILQRLEGIFGNVSTTQTLKH